MTEALKAAMMDGGRGRDCVFILYRTDDTPGLEKHYPLLQIYRTKLERDLNSIMTNHPAPTDEEIIAWREDIEDLLGGEVNWSYCHPYYDMDAETEQAQVQRFSTQVIKSLGYADRQKRCLEAIGFWLAVAGDEACQSDDLQHDLQTILTERLELFYEAVYGEVAWLKERAASEMAAAILEVRGLITE